MTSPPGRGGSTGDVEPGGPFTEGHRYALWDAAYVLGSLSAADRREFELHLTDCPACREAVADISGMPGLLAQLERNDAAVLDQAVPATEMPPAPTELLPSLLSAVHRRRRRNRVITWAATTSAAAVLTIGVLVGLAGHAPSSAPQPTVAALPMAQVGTTALASTVAVSSQRWGSVIDLQCVCLAPVYAHHDTLAMVVIGRDGSHTRLATWVAEPGRTATPTGSISTPAGQIAAVQVVSADDGHVLLERSW